ncbi:MAG: radical SAM protein [Candidatus Woesebacteria bacterium]|jgi:radical SAM superfamily enzyme YgiQ (UPF0313 family)
MTDLIFFNPKSFNVLPSYLPYGLLYLAAFLREKGVSTKIYDANTMDNNFWALLKKEKPAIVGISILSGPCLIDAVATAKKLRQSFPKIKIIFGGIHATIFPKDVLKQPYVDYVVMNEGEEALWELCQFLLAGKGRLKNIKNLAYKQGKKLIFNQIRAFIDLNQLPLPAWDLLPIEKYIHNKFYSDRVITLHTSRGCPWDCSFCYNRLVNFRHWRGMSADKILQQIECLINNYQIKGFQFYDDEFDVSQKRVKDFCQLLLKKKVKIKWAHYSRTNLANKKRYALEKKAGCEFVEFGVESGSARILKMLNKQQTLANIRNAFKVCHKVGLKTGAMFMTALPTETKKEVKKTVKLIKSLQAYQTINTIFRPYPGSQLFNYCLAEALIKLPKKIEDQGKFFDISSTKINVSKIDSDYLANLQASFFFNNVWQEIKLALEYKNFKLLFSHFKSHLNFTTLILLLRGFRNKAQL